MAIIFDLDQTLVDSRAVEPLRKARQWSQVYPRIPHLPVYPGINELLAMLKAHGLPVCVVTSSPRPYYSKVCSFHGWPIIHSVCYHDASPHKPHPAPILAGVKLLGVAADEVVAIGDDPKDVIAAKTAGVFSVASTWGCLSTHRNYWQQIPTIVRARSMSYRISLLLGSGWGCCNGCSVPSTDSDPRVQPAIFRGVRARPGNLPACEWKLPVAYQEIDCVAVH